MRPYSDNLDSVLSSTTVTGLELAGTTSSLTDSLTTIATITNAAGSGVSGAAGVILRGAPYVAIPISGATFLNGLRAGNSEEMFSGGYGLTTIGVALVSPEVAAGMALAKILYDVTAPPKESIFTEAALLLPAQVCTGG